MHVWPSHTRARACSAGPPGFAIVSCKTPVHPLDRIPGKEWVSSVVLTQNGEPLSFGGKKGQDSVKFVTVAPRIISHPTLVKASMAKKGVFTFTIKVADEVTRNPFTHPILLTFVIVVVVKRLTPSLSLSVFLRALFSPRHSVLRPRPLRPVRKDTPTKGIKISVVSSHEKTYLPANRIKASTPAADGTVTLEATPDVDELKKAAAKQTPIDIKLTLTAADTYGLKSPAVTLTVRV